ncbi:MAG: multiheme c-type cytochrome [bacterium]|nr:multiheme c-type cytochrome [bacterium]
MNKLLLAPVFFIIIIFLQFCKEEKKEIALRAPDYVGSHTCKSCHVKEYDNFLLSDHFHALDSASSKSVKGNFEKASFVYFGDTTFFYTRNGDYFVRTIDSTGQHTEFRISYTLGWQPLQQYLVSFPSGRLQTLPFCWDTRSKENGGQRWFHINDKEKISPGDELFWTDINMNWNTMCADCHTTDFYKNYDVTTNEFHSTWKEDRVSCESCHGPASNHLAWVNEKKTKKDSLKGFSIDLKGEKPQWVMNSEKGIAMPDRKTENGILLETCARCHSRSTRLSDEYRHGKSLLQTHMPATIDTTNYYLDGQIKNEDYEYGSFLQSKMYAAGVTCINCHEAHSMKIKEKGNLLCSSCHLPSKYDVADHTHHTPQSKGSQCVNCHMPVTTFMVVDNRLDHSIRIPRPDLSLQQGTPNACNTCHTDKSTTWAANAFSNWFATKLPTKKTYGELLHLISKNGVESQFWWNELMKSEYPDIIKASALRQNNRFYNKESINQILTHLESRDPNLRLNALNAMSGFPDELAVSTLSKMIKDPVLALRLEVISKLAPFYSKLEGRDRSAFELGLNEYLLVEEKLSDRPEGYLNRGIILASVGRVGEAEKVYLQGITRHPIFIGSYLNLADLYRTQKRDDLAKIYMEKGLRLQPSNAALHFSLGLWHIRMKDKVSGFKEIDKAHQLAPSDAYYTYTYAVTVQESGAKVKSLQILENYLAQFGNDPLILDALITFYRDFGNNTKAVYYSDLRSKVFGS